ncbi:protease complex subunit PrcB family protein [Kordia sp.]|uniref:protease complex subunit PrcB family protein n=1 Tax=Kordia sp. TaxID=1965332 RepID=UPI003D27092A
MKKCIFLCVVSLFLLSCDSDDSETTNTTIETTLIGVGNLYIGSSQGVDEQNLIINNESEWNALITLFDAANDVSSTFTETDVDFTAFTVIVAIDQVRPNGGHLLDIAVNANSENIVVTVTSLVPQGAATTVFTQPYHIVKIPKNTLPVIFE